MRGRHYYASPAAAKAARQAQHYFRAPRNDDAVADVSEQMTAELDSILQMLESAGRDQSAYGKTLSMASGELGNGALASVERKPSGVIRARPTVITPVALTWTR